MEAARPVPPLCRVSAAQIAIRQFTIVDGIGRTAAFGVAYFGVVFQELPSRYQIHD